MASSGNFCTMNQIDTGSYQTITEGNLKVGGTGSSTADQAKRGATFYVQSGKWYWEVRQTVGGSSYGSVGISVGSAGTGTPLATSGFSQGLMYQSIAGTLEAVAAGYVGLGTVTTTSTGVSAVSNNQVINIALDMDNRKLWFGKDGTYFNSGNPASGSNPQFSWTTDTFVTPTSRNYATNRPSHYNFGQDSTFGGNETAGGNADDNSHGDFHSSVPTGFLALCSGNLPVSDDIDPAQTDNDYPSKQFGVITYTGNGGVLSVTGLGFKPDLVWGKMRSPHSYNNMLYDSSRGANRVLQSDTTNAEIDLTSSNVGLRTFDSDGFTLGSEASLNDSGDSIVAWCWRANGGTTSSNSSGDITSTVQANTKAGFSIVTYTGNGSVAQSIGHGLSSGAPEFILVKNRSQADAWAVYHHSLGNAAHLILNTTDAQTTSSAYWGSFTPTTTLFKVGSDHKLNASSENYVAYLWHGVEGYSKFGSFEGNSNADGPFIYTGFRPRLVFCKAADASENWQVRDTARSTFNADSQVRIYWNSSNAEGSASTASPIDFLSNGFKVRGSNSEINTNTIVYGAWGDVPFKYNNTF